VAHATSRNTAAITFFGLLSLFPLVFVFSALMSLIARPFPGVHGAIVDAVSADLAVLDDMLNLQNHTLSGDLISLTVAVTAAVWGATRAFATVQATNDEIWDVPQHLRDSGARRRLRSVLALLAFGVRAIVVAAASFVAGVVTVGPLATAFAAAAAIAANIWLVFALMALSSQRPPWRELLPGAIIAALAFAVLQNQSARLVALWSEGTTPAHAATIGMLAVMWGHVLVLQATAELNVALAEHRHSRRSTRLMLTHTPGER
jgi:membrane protein